MPEQDRSSLKPGDSTVYKIGGFSLELKPIPWGRVKKLMQEILTVAGRLSDFADMKPEDILREAPDRLNEACLKVMPLLFDQSTHDFIDERWIENNMTIPLARTIVLDAIRINGLEDFFAKMGRNGSMAKPLEARDLQEVSRS